MAQHEVRPLGPGPFRDYLRALQMLLAKAPPSWPAGHAFESLRTVLDRPGPVDWGHETDSLLARLGEVERAVTPPVGESKP
jgi:hypothetical protein